MVKLKIEDRIQEEFVKTNPHQDFPVPRMGANGLSVRMASNGKTSDTPRVDEYLELESPAPLLG